MRRSARIALIAPVRFGVSTKGLLFPIYLPCCRYEGRCIPALIQLVFIQVTSWTLDPASPSTAGRFQSTNSAFQWSVDLLASILPFQSTKARSLHLLPLLPIVGGGCRICFQNGDAGLGGMVAASGLDCHQCFAEANTPSTRRRLGGSVKGGSGFTLRGEGKRKKGAKGGCQE